MADKADLFSDTLSSYTDDTVPVSRKSQYAKQFYRAPPKQICDAGTGRLLMLFVFFCASHRKFPFPPQRVVAG